MQAPKPLDPKLMFSLITPNREYLFCALSETSKTDWVELIAGNLAEVKVPAAPFLVSNNPAPRRPVQETSTSSQVEQVVVSFGFFSFFSFC